MTEQSAERSVRVVDDFYRALQAKDLDAFARLWAADAVYRVPVTPDGVPGEFTGRAAIVAGLGGFFSLFGEVRFTWQAEAMADPRRVLATWEMEIELLAGGTYRNRGTSVFQLERGLITHFTEHVDTAAFLALFSARAATAHRFFALLDGGDLEAWGELWDPHGTWNAPYAPGRLPHPVEGRAEIVAACRELLAGKESFGVEVTGVHAAVNSDAVCVQYRPRAGAAGQADGGEAVAVLRFAGGLVSAWHDYAGPRPSGDGAAVATPGAGAAR
ncbi:nuclear transport factor 2 family protein [Streptomyces flavalbus]|uniref:Nuclear transport factor 2 family protein n=1 Tax=Streptomyces flavalbus TaxID=2665155 RepID=A0ABW2WKC8_9ACTN